jgi:hypothetical protein
MLKLPLLLAELAANIAFSCRRTDRPDANTRLVQLFAEASRGFKRQFGNIYAVHISDFQQ